MRFFRQPDTVTRLGDFLKAELAARRWREFRAAVAFAKRSGVDYLADELAMFASRGSIRISIGVDLHGTSKEGLQALLDAVTAHGGQVWIFHNEEPLQPTFHPKVYVFKKPHAALVIIGSGNLTAGGLFTNYEAGAIFELDLDEDADDALLREVEAALDAWSDPTQRLARVLTPEFLEDLERRGLVRPESRTRGDEIPEVERGDTGERAPGLFGQVRVPRAPRRARPHGRQARRTRGEQAAGAAPVRPLAVADYFVISVLEGDLPQAGSSNEIRITKGIRDVNPAFWGWPNQFAGPDSNTGQYHRDVRIRFQGRLLNAYLKDFPARKPDGTKASADFRIGSIAPIVHELREEDDLLVLTRSSDRRADYIAQIVHKFHVNQHMRWANGLIQHTRARSTSTGTYKKYRYGPRS